MGRGNENNLGILSLHLWHSLTYYSNYCSNTIVEKFHNPEELGIYSSINMLCLVVF